MMVSEWSIPVATDEDTTLSLGTLPESSTLIFEPVGRWYEALCRRRHEKHSLSHHSIKSSSSEDEEEDLGEGDEDDEHILSTLDPKEWRNQDHYLVLGLAHLRYKATDDQIKKAYKRKVLKHHPDKRRASGLAVKDGEEDYFTCITRAWETLGNPAKRRSFDSVDPDFDNAIPTLNSETKQNFCQVFGPVFERNSRWSKKKPVPQLGKENAAFDEVNSFYAFWYDLDSWREYSYLDEEEKEKGENRDERRWIEKQNKAARAKRKKEETSRIRLLIDNAYSCDPRIAQFKEDEKQRKLAEKQAKRDAFKAKADEEERIKQEALAEERKKKEKEEEEAKAVAAAVKKEKDAQKKMFRKERKTLRTAMKEFDYFETDETLRVNTMQEVDKLAELLSITNLQSLNESMTAGDAAQAKIAFHQKVDELNAQLEEENRQQMEAARRQAADTNGRSTTKAAWVDQEVQMLIKAVNLFPAGTVARWDTVASFISQHVEGSNRSAKEVLAKAKDLQKLDTTLKQEANKKAFQVFSQDSRLTASNDTPEISERYESVAEQQIGVSGSNPAPWTTDEQKLLEQALRTYSSNLGAERWEKISETIPTRSKKDCMKRYKELAELVKAKKAATQAAALKGKR